MRRNCVAAVSTTLMPGFVGTELPEWLAARLRDGLGGVCLFGKNIVSREQLRALTAAIRAANPHAIIAIDEEGGDVTRLYYDIGFALPGQRRARPPATTSSYTESVGRAGRLGAAPAGCNLNFAPDVDINSNSDNPVIGVRSFGADPSAVARARRRLGPRPAGDRCRRRAPSTSRATATPRSTRTWRCPSSTLSSTTLRERELVPFRGGDRRRARRPS